MTRTRKTETPPPPNKAIEPEPMTPRPARWERRTMGPGWMLTNDGTEYQFRAIVFPSEAYPDKPFIACLRGTGYEHTAWETEQEAKGWAETEVAKLDAEGHQWVAM